MFMLTANADGKFPMLVFKNNTICFYQNQMNKEFFNCNQPRLFSYHNKWRV